MSSSLANQIETLLAGIESIQESLAAIYRDKREAIRKADAPELDRLSERERGLIGQLEAALRQRNALLQAARVAGKPCDSLEQLVGSLPAPERDRLLPRIARTRRAADINRRESWVVWIVARQSLRVLGEMIDLIAHGGRKAPIYSARPDSDVVRGGAILDASA